jgi:hypothetical protein
MELQYSTTESYSSSQPVVPQITGILLSMQSLILSTALFGVVNKIATSESSMFLSFVFWSIILPIL